MKSTASRKRAKILTVGRDISTSLTNNNYANEVTKRVITVNILEEDLISRKKRGSQMKVIKSFFQTHCAKN